MPAPTKPSPLYVWDSNGTHVVAPTSGHQSDGYVNNEVPGSGETNGLLQNWSEELAWLDYQVSALIASQSLWQPPGLTVTSGGALLAANYADLSILLYAGTAATVRSRMNALPVGSVIQSARVTY